MGSKDEGPHRDYLHGLLTPGSASPAAEMQA
jgi:hypothetical protein